jgi:hypothetical protein
MTDPLPPENDLAAEFRRLGENLRSALQSAWESEERLRLQDEIERGLRHGDEAFRAGRALGDGLGRHVDHARLAFLVEVAELHLPLPALLPPLAAHRLPCRQLRQRGERVGVRGRCKRQRKPLPLTLTLSPC